MTLRAETFFRVIRITLVFLICFPSGAALAADGRKAVPSSREFPPAAAKEAGAGPAAVGWSRLPMVFEANRGQCDDRVAFLARASLLQGYSGGQRRAGPALCQALALQCA